MSAWNLKGRSLASGPYGWRPSGGNPARLISAVRRHLEPCALSYVHSPQDNPTSPLHPHAPLWGTVCFWCQSLRCHDIGVIQGFHRVDFSKKSIGALPINVWQPPLSQSDVPGQTRLGKASFTNGVQELVVANMVLLTSGDGCKVIWHGDPLTTLTMLTMKIMLASNTMCTNN